MFLWDFVADKVMGQIVDWIYSKLLEFLGEFFGMMGSMGADLFDYDFVRAIIELFRLFGWALFVSGMVVAVFEIAVEYQSGRGSIKDACLNAMKGFMAVSLFTVLPVELYKFCISLQVTMSNGLAKLVGSQSVGDSAIKSLSYMQKLSLGTVLLIFLLITVGSLYMFSIVRGYTDGFIQWCKQIIGICLTAFLQAVILIAGLGVMKENCLLGIGLILAASEIPRIAGQFGLDTSMKANIMSTVYAAQSAMNITKTIMNRS